MPTKILAIDDSKTMRLAVKITFAAEDAEVVAINRGTDALARAKQLQPDVILVDHQLSDGDITGVDLCRQFRGDPATAGVPLIFLVPTRGGVSESIVAQAGADAVVTKPFDTQELIDRVSELVKRGAAAKPSRPVASPVHASAPTPAPAVAPREAVRSVAQVAPSPVAASPLSATTANAAVARPATHVAVASPVPVAVASAPVSAGQREIPIVTPIPFAMANAPTQSMLERLRAQMGGASSGIDPKAIEALLALSHDVVERIAWEVIPDLAEAILREKSAQ